LAHLEEVARDYLGAFDARDLTRCVDFFAEDATLAWQAGVYRGRPAIEEWHKDRFQADLRLVRVDGIGVEGNVVTVDGVATSKRLRAWRIGSLGGRVIFIFDEDKIRDTKFTVRVTNPLENWA